MKKLLNSFETLSSISFKTFLKSSTSIADLTEKCDEVNEVITNAIAGKESEHYFNDSIQRTVKLVREHMSRKMNIEDLITVAELMEVIEHINKKVKNDMFEISQCNDEDITIEMRAEVLTLLTDQPNTLNIDFVGLSDNNNNLIVKTLDNKLDGSEYSIKDIALFIHKHEITITQKVPDIINIFSFEKQTGNLLPLPIRKKISKYILTKSKCNLNEPLNADQYKTVKSLKSIYNFEFNDNETVSERVKREAKDEDDLKYICVLFIASGIANSTNVTEENDNGITTFHDGSKIEFK